MFRVPDLDDFKFKLQQNRVWSGSVRRKLRLAMVGICRNLGMEEEAPYSELRKLLEVPRD